MTRRTNSSARPAPFREERPQILIVCGGEKTELDYFRGLKSNRRNPAIRATLKDKGVSPEGVVRHSIKLRSLGDYDEVWCVFDVDQFDLDGAARLTRREDVKLAVSNPCFEYGAALDHPAARVTSVIPGARSPEQARANATAASLPPLPEATMDAIGRLYHDRVCEQVHHRW